MAPWVAERLSLELESMPFVTRSDALAPSSILLLVVMPGATSSVLAPSSDALCIQICLCPIERERESNLF